MSNLTPEQRLAENEMIIRKYNEERQVAAKDVLDKSDQENMLLEFYCECDDLNCPEKIISTVSQYEDVHRNRKRFMVKAKHVNPAIEKIIEPDSLQVIVEKIVPLPRQA